MSAIDGDHHSLSDTTGSSGIVGGGEVASDNVWHADSDLENELEVTTSQMHYHRFGALDNVDRLPVVRQKRAKNGWSGWSEWSTCSRSCDGGVAQQLRRCHVPDGCRGEPIRYRLCNMQVSTMHDSQIHIVHNTSGLSSLSPQACPDLQDYRAHQCSVFDDVPYDGQLYKWQTHYDYSEPCALTCRGHTLHYRSDDGGGYGQSGAETAGDNQSDEEPVVVAQLAKRVQDGTRCRLGSLDICIQGKCQVNKLVIPI